MRLGGDSLALRWIGIGVMWHRLRLRMRLRLVRSAPSSERKTRYLKKTLDKRKATLYEWVDCKICTRCSTAETAPPIPQGCRLRTSWGASA